MHFRTPILGLLWVLLLPSSIPAADSSSAPKGQVSKHTFAQSKIFPGTVRDYWVYVPKQYDAAKPAPVMVFQDGLQYDAPTVFDRLIAEGKIPALIGIFVMHGRVPGPSGEALDRFNRSYEYDGLGDEYARFLLNELLPHITVSHQLNLSTNGNDRAIAGNSSGAICAFTAAWQRPDAFRRVFSAIGTYVGLRGGNSYPVLIRKTEPKPIRIFLQDGSNDLNIYGGNWWIANQDMLSALQFAGYDVRHAWDEEGHNSKEATKLFPEAVQWLWRDWPAPLQPNNTSKQPVMEILLAGQPWQVVSTGHRYTEGPAVNRQGEVFFTDIPNNRIHKIGLDGAVTVFAEETGGVNGLEFGPDNQLYACANRNRQIIAYDTNATARVVAPNVPSNDLVINQQGDIYFTDPGNKQVWHLPKNGSPRVVDQGIGRPNGLVLSPDQSLLLVADTAGQFVYSFQVQPDGSLAHKQRYFWLHLADGSTQSGADGMTVDTQGRLYVTTELGLQICDQAGRVQAIISKPQQAWLANVTFGGPSLDELFVTCGDKVYKRRTQARGIRSTEAPIKPPRPRL